MQEQSVDYQRKWYVMAAVAMWIFISTIDGSIVNVALPTLVSFNTDFAIVQWVVLSYLLAVTTLIMSMGRLGDMVGKKPVYATGLVFFTLGSALCGLSPSVYWLIVRIGHLGVSAGRLDVEDRARPKPFGTTFAPVTFELSDFRTSGSGNSFAFAAGSDLAGRLSLEGGFAVEPLSSQGSVKVAGLQATAISEYLGELLPVELRAGVIDLGFTYDFSLAGEPFTFVLDMPSLAIRGLSTQGRGYDVPWLFQAIDVRGTRVDLAARSVVIQSVTAQGIEAPVWLDANGFHAPGALGLLVQTSSQGAVAADAAAATPAPAAGEEGPEWTVSVPVMGSSLRA